MLVASFRGRSVLAHERAAQLCLCLSLIGCAVPDDKTGKKSAPESEANTEDQDTSFDAGPAPRGAGMPNVPIHRADAGASKSADASLPSDADAAAVSTSALDAAVRDAGLPPVNVSGAGGASAMMGSATTPPTPLHRYSFSGTGMSVPDEQGGKDALVKGNAMLDGKDVVDLVSMGDGLVELPSDTLGDLADFSVLVWLYPYSDACWQRALDLTYTQEVTTTSTPSGPGGNMGPGGGAMTMTMTMTMTHTDVTLLYLTPYGCPGELPTLGYVTSTSNYQLIGKQAATQNEELQLGLTYNLRSQTLRLIVDGKVASEQRVLLDLHALHRAKPWLGRSSMLSDTGLDGSISELRVYGSTLEPAALQQIYERGPDQL